MKIKMKIKMKSYRPKHPFLQILDAVLRWLEEAVSKIFRR